MAFVRVSGYGRDDIIKAQKEGQDQFLEQCAAESPFAGQVYVETNKTTTYTLFSNKTVSKHSLLIITLQAATSGATSTSDPPMPYITVTASQGSVRRIYSFPMSGYKSGELDLALRCEYYEVPANSVISATYQIPDRNSNVMGYAQLINV